MKTLTFILALLLTMNSYCYFDTLHPVLFIYDSKVYTHQTKIFSHFRIDADTGQYVIVFDSMPKHIDPYSIEFFNNQAISIQEVHAFVENPAKQSLSDVYDKIIVLKGLIDEIDIERIKIESKEKAIQVESIKQIREADFDERLAIIQKANKQIKILREYAQLEQTKHQNVTDEISFLLANAKRKKPRTFQRVYIKIDVLLPITEKLELSYNLHHTQQDLQQSTLNKNEPKVNGYWLSGKVYDPKTGDFLIRANVYISFNGNVIALINTDYEGNFNLELSQPGPFEVNIEQGNYKSKKLKSVALIKNQANYLDIPLKQANPVNAIQIMSLAIPIIEVMKDF